MNLTIGFIGGGNMGSAIIGGILSAQLVPQEQIIVSDASAPILSGLEATYGIKTTSSNLKVAAEADILFLAVKPNIFPIVIPEISMAVKADATVVSIAAGQTIGTIEELFNRQLKLVRCMPNTPALAGAGMTGICANTLVSMEEMDNILSIFNKIGKSEIVPEYMMDVITGVSGSSPAYVYLFIEAMADAAVSEGMPRAQAYQFSAQAVLGAAKMVLETNQHPGLLKDQVCSPGGTTIAAVCELEKQGMRNAVISAVKTCVEKSRQMSKK